MAIYLDLIDSTLPQPFGTPRRTYFPDATNSPDSFLFEQDYVIERASFSPLALDTPHPDIPDAYLVEETPWEDIGGNVVKWTRVYSKIPAAWRDYESFAWTIPGLGAPGSAYAVRSVTGQSLSGGTHTVTTASTVGGSTGNLVTITYNVTDNGGTVTRRILREITAGGTTSTSFDAVVDIATPSYQTIQRVDIGRDARTEVVSSTIFREYFLPGVTPNVDNVEDIPILRPDVILDSSGFQTDAYGTTTTPARVDYIAQLGSLIVAEASNLTRWRGNIFERATRYVVAI